MVSLDRGLEEALALLNDLEHDEDDERGKRRAELAIMAVERARELLGDHAGEVLHHEDW
jgi:hypothetical protein